MYACINVISYMISCTAVCVCIYMSGDMRKQKIFMNGNYAGVFFFVCSQPKWRRKLRTLFHLEVVTFFDCIATYVWVCNVRVCECALSSCPQTHMC